MSIKVICSRCGGSGRLHFLQFEEDKSFWEDEECPNCRGSGTVSEESFEERKKKEVKSKCL